MVYKYIQPGPALREFVKDYLLAHFVFDQTKPIPFKPYAPKPEQGLTFFLKGYVSIADLTNTRLSKAPRVSLFGQQVSRYNFHLTQEYLMLRVHFHPGALYRLLGIPLVEFKDKYADAAAIMGKEVEEVNERMSNVSAYTEMIQLLEEFLTGKIKKTRTDKCPLDRTAAEMVFRPGRSSIDQLAKQACLSPRQFNRKFKERLGIGPKMYSRIIRFHRAYQYKEMYPESDWLSVAVLFGYADYQHLVKDFKEFAGVTPSIWIHQDNSSPERILNLE